MRTGVPEFALSEEQNQDLAKASANVLRHFPKIALSQKQQDILALLYVSGKIGYAQRQLYIQRKQEEAAKANAENVAQFKHQGPQ